MRAPSVADGSIGAWPPPFQLATDDGEDGRSFAFDFAPGDAEDAVVDGEEFAVAFAIALEGDLDRVVTTAVGFDDEPLLVPEEVDLEDRSSVWTGALICGIGRPAATSSGSSFASKRLRTVAYLAVSATGRQSSRMPRRQGAPRRRGPEATIASIAPRSSRRAVAARSTVSRRSSSP